MKIAILGAGISGLSLGWFLKQRHGSKIDLTIFEKSGRAGGLIRALKSTDYLWELGPRSCRTKGKGKETLALIESLDLQEQVVTPLSDAHNRFIYDGKKLVRLPKKLWEFPFNPMTKGWLQALVQDLMHHKNTIEDQSVYEFFSKRLGASLTEHLIDPFVSGIFAGDCRRLSIRSCFPVLVEWAEKYGSLIRGGFKHTPYPIKQTPFINKMVKYPLFSFRQGMGVLTDHLADQLRDSLLLNYPIDRIELNKEKISLFGLGKKYEFDSVISTLPCPALSPLLKDFPAIETQLNSLPYASVVLVHMVFKGDLLNLKGFGYLIPSRFQQKILGCVIDSSIFAEHQSGQQTRITFMLGGSRHPEIIEFSDEEIIAICKPALKDHLNIAKEPETIHIFRNPLAIPQFEVGHENWKKKIEEDVKAISPHLYLGGTAFSGVSINDCIVDSHRIANILQKMGYRTTVLKRQTEKKSHHV